MRFKHYVHHMDRQLWVHHAGLKPKKAPAAQTLPAAEMRFIAFFC